MSFHTVARRSTLAAVSALALLVAGAAQANGVHLLYDPLYSIGFDGTNPVFSDPYDFEILDEGDLLGIGSTPNPGSPHFDLDQCVSLAENGPCIGSGGIAVGTPYYSIVTMTLATPVPVGAVDGILIFVAGLQPGSEYTVDEIHFDVDPGPTDFQTISYFTYDYLGFQFTGQGQSFQFRYHADAMKPSKTPVLETFYTADFVPEPGTGVLLGLGLAGLAAHRRRR